MKVEQGQQLTGVTTLLVSPIIITIETQEEADLMWGKLNTSYYDVVPHTHRRLPDKPKEGMISLNCQMWTAFDSVYNIDKR